MLSTSSTPELGVTGLARKSRPELLQRTTAMTIEIFYLTAQIQRWLNVRVARHLEAQAARLAR